MPELPEVETIANGLHKRVSGNRIESVWIGRKPEPLKSPATAIAKTLEGARVERVRRVGKHIVFDLLRNSVHGNGQSTRGQWIVHLGMTGRMLVANPDTEIPKHTHLVARLSSGSELRVADPPRLGRLEVRGADFAGPCADRLTIHADHCVPLVHTRAAHIRAILHDQTL